MSGQLIAELPQRLHNRCADLPPALLAHTDELIE